VCRSAICPRLPGCCPSRQHGRFGCSGDSDVMAPRHGAWRRLSLRSTIGGVGGALWKAVAIRHERTTSPGSGRPSANSSRPLRGRGINRANPYALKRVFCAGSNDGARVVGISMPVSVTHGADGVMSRSQCQRTINHLPRPKFGRQCAEMTVHGA
jgi:hypothetical protein